MARTSARAQALELARIAAEQTQGLNKAGLVSPMMAASATQEIADKLADDEASVAAHIKRLNGGVSRAEYEKALHTIASFHAMPMQGVDRKTGEITNWDPARNEIREVLNSVCYAYVKLLNPEDKDFSTVGRLQKARDRLIEDQQALSEGGEINVEQARRQMELVDLREVILASVQEAQTIAERVYETRTGKAFERRAPKLKPVGAKVTDASEKAKLLAEMAKRTKVEVAAPVGDVPFDMAVHSADDRSTLTQE